MLLSDATARYDDRSERQVGDVLFEDSRTVIAKFGSKCDRGGAGKPAAMPAATEPGSDGAFLADSVRRAMARLLDSLPEVPATLARGFAAAGQDRLPSADVAGGRGDVAGGRGDVAGGRGDVAGGRGNVAGGRAGPHPPPLRGRHPGAPPPGRCSPPGPSAWSAGTPPTSGRTAAALFHAGLPRPFVTKSLQLQVRHASARSDES